MDADKTILKKVPQAYELLKGNNSEKKFEFSGVIASPGDLGPS